MLRRRFRGLGLQRYGVNGKAAKLPAIIIVALAVVISASGFAFAAGLGRTTDSAKADPSSSSEPSGTDALGSVPPASATDASVTSSSASDPGAGTSTGDSSSTGLTPVDLSAPTTPVTHPESDRLGSTICAHESCSTLTTTPEQAAPVTAPESSFDSTPAADDPAADAPSSDAPASDAPATNDPATEAPAPAASTPAPADSPPAVIPAPAPTTAKPVTPTPTPTTPKPSVSPVATTKPPVVPVPTTKPPVVVTPKPTPVVTTPKPAPVTQAPAPAPAPVPISGPVRGQDVSGHQGNINWSASYAKGSRFAYIKTTEGTGYQSSYFAQQYAGSKNAGIVRGAYHFALPDRSSGTTQAAYFVTHGGGWSPDGWTLPPMLDIEYNPYGSVCYGMSGSAMSRWVGDFSNEVKRRTGRYPTIYTTRNWWNTCTGSNASFGATNPLFLACYCSGPGRMPAGWSYQTIWQYSDSGALPGDQDLFNGSYASLRRFAL